MLRRLLIGALALAVLLCFEKDARSHPPKTEPRYYDFDEVLAMHGAGNIKIEKLGEFQTVFKGEDWQARPVRSWCNTPTERISIVSDSTQTTLRINGMTFRLDRLCTKPNNKVQGAMGVDVDGESLYRFVAGADTFSCFYANNFKASFHFHWEGWMYIVNHRLRSVNIFDIYPNFCDDEPLIGDVNKDSIPEILYPDFSNNEFPVLLDTVARMTLIPYQQDSLGNFSPMKQSNGKALRFYYKVDFNRMWEQQPFIQIAE